MPELIGEDKGVAKTVTHRDCGAIIRYYDGERKEAVHYDYGGGSDVVRWIVCPKCGNEVYVK